MWLVTIFGAYILIKEEFRFDSIHKANEFLSNKHFTFDECDEDVHYWHLDDDTFACIQKRIEG